MHIYVYLVLYIVRLLLELLYDKGSSDQQKDLEILLLRHRLRILQRRLPRSPRVSIWEKGILAVLAAQFRRCSKTTGRKLDEALLLLKPDTPWLCREPWYSAGTDN